MFLAMHNWMRAEPIEVTIRRMVKCGYQSIEIEGEPEKYNTKEVRKLLKENGISCFGAVSLMYEGRDLIHANEAVRAGTIQYIKDCVTMTKELEGREVTVVPSTVGKITPMASEEEEWKWAIEGLKEIYAHSEKAGVVLGIEPINRFETYFIYRADQAVLLAEEIGSNCGVCLDAFHLNIEEADLYQSILNTGDRLVDFHVADNNRLACGLGHHNWVRLVSTLETAGYNGPLSVEFVPPLDRTPANPHKNASAEAEAELTSGQLSFIENHSSGILSSEFYTWQAQVSANTLRSALKEAGVDC